MENPSVFRFVLVFTDWYHNRLFKKTISYILFYSKNNKKAIVIFEWNIV